MIHLDTSFLILALRPGTAQDRMLRRWLADRRPIAVCSVAWAEFRCGPLEASELAAAGAIIERHRAFTKDDAETSAQMFNATGRRRGSIVDCMIAAAAVADGATVATANPADFERLREFGVITAEP